MTAGDEIRLSKPEGQTGWTAVDIETGVASQGETRTEALEMLDEAVALQEGDIGRQVTDEDLEEWGLDPEAVPEETTVPDAPWFES